MDGPSPGRESGGDGRESEKNDNDNFFEWTSYSGIYLFQLVLCGLANGLFVVNGALEGVDEQFQVHHRDLEKGKPEGSEVEQVARITE